MSRVLAAVDNSAAARPVLAFAGVVAGLYDAGLEAVHQEEDGHRSAEGVAKAAHVPFRTVHDGDAEALVEACGDDDVIAMVLGARGSTTGRRPAGRTALELIRTIEKPLVVVPPDAPVPLALTRVLVPLDGTTETAEALRSTVELVSGSQAEVVILHVREHDVLPLFSEQPQHELRAWAEEFLARNCPSCEGLRLVWRVGAPGEHVLQVASEVEADLIALGWARDLSLGRALTVREVLARTRVPVLLVPRLDSRVRAAGRQPRESSVPAG
jgi:nucleotide-binding universal stress UspA family protein